MEKIEYLNQCTGILAKYGVAEPIEGFLKRPQDLVGCIDDLGRDKQALWQMLDDVVHNWLVLGGEKSLPWVSAAQTLLAKTSHAFTPCRSSWSSEEIKEVFKPLPENEASILREVME